MKVDRDPNRPVRHLEWRVRLLGVGAILALAGIYFDSGWMVNVALAVLLTSFLLRFKPEKGGEEESAGEGTAESLGESPGDPRTG